MSEVWALPGYDVEALLGYGRGGEVWRGLDRDTGDPVALTRLRPDVDRAAADRLHQLAHVLCALETPYVVRLRAVVGEGPGTVVVHDLASGGSLAGLLGRRQRLSAPELVTVAVPLAQALAVLHEQGLAYGDISASGVLLTGDGMPVLAEVGMAEVRGTTHGGPAAQADDVHDLAVLCAELLGAATPELLPATVPEPLRTALSAACRTDPEQRPSAVELSALVRRSHSAAPLRWARPAAPASAGQAATDSVPADQVLRPSLRATTVLKVAGPPLPGPRTPQPRAPRSSRSAALVGAAVLAVALAAVLGWLWGRGGPTEAAVLTHGSAVTPPVAPPRTTPLHTPLTTLAAAVAEPALDWPAVLDRLDQSRAAVLGAADPAGLSELYAPASPALAVDAAAVADLQRSGRRARGVRHRIVSVREVHRASATVTLLVRDVLGAYDVLGPTGDAVRHVAARPAASWSVVLAQVSGSWRIRQVTPA